TLARPERRGKEPPGREPLNPHHCAGDIDNQIASANLVEVNITGVDAVDAGFGASEPLKDSDRVGFYSMGKRGSIDQVLYVGKPTSRLLRFTQAHLEFGRRNSAPEDTRGGDVVAREAERGNATLEKIQIEA